MLIDRRAMLAGMAATPLLAATNAQAPVTIFEARKIVTMERSLPAARFVAVSGGIILGVANTLEALAPWTRGREVSIERRFAGKVLFPGLIDPHIHPMQAAVMLNLPFLAPDEWHLPSGHWPGIVGQDTWRSRLKRLLAEDQSNPLVCWGYHDMFHGPLDKAELDAIAPDRPLFIWQRSFHDIYCNSAALESIGVGTAESFNAALAAGKADPHHSSFERGVFSETGLLVALGKLQSTLLSPQRMVKGFADLATMMRQRGVTTTSDMATGIFAPFDVEAGLIARSFGAPTSSARAMLMPIAAELMQVDDLDSWLAEKRGKFTNANVGLDRRVKLLADGAFFAQNMRMGAPGYTDGHIGKWITEPAELRAQINRFSAAGFALHIHVNGDEGADEVLSALAQLPQEALRRITLEHVGYCTEAQARQIARMGLMVSAQPNYIRVLGKAYSEHGLGPDRASLMNRLGTLERGHVPLGLHSDFNMAPIDPFYLAWIAETREGIDGTARAPNERLTRTKALRAITVEAAQVIGMDSSIGSIASGKKADFTVLDSDPHDMPAEALKEMPIRATVFEGNVAEG